jgi:hypothetical protein
LAGLTVIGRKVVVKKILGIFMPWLLILKVL